jgi:subtilase family serine protease
MQRCWGADTGDPVECVVTLDADNRIAELNESNNSAKASIPSLQAADERQGQ